MKDESTWQYYRLWVFVIISYLEIAELHCRRIARDHLWRESLKSCNFDVWLDIVWKHVNSLMIVFFSIFCIDPMQQLFIEEKIHLRRVSQSLSSAVLSLRCDHLVNIIGVNKKNEKDVMTSSSSPLSSSSSSSKPLAEIISDYVVKIICVHKKLIKIVNCHQCPVMIAMIIITFRCIPICSLDRSYLCSRFPGCLRFGGHRPLQLDWQSHVFAGDGQGGDGWGGVGHVANVQWMTIS